MQNEQKHKSKHSPAMHTYSSRSEQGKLCCSVKRPQRGVLKRVRTQDWSGIHLGPEMHQRSASYPIKSNSLTGYMLLSLSCTLLTSQPCRKNNMPCKTERFLNCNKCEITAMLGANRCGVRTGEWVYRLQQKSCITDLSLNASVVFYSTLFYQLKSFSLIWYIIWYDMII